MSPGETVRVEKLPVEKGDRIELDRVLVVHDGAQMMVGTPVVPGAKVVARVAEHGRGKKIIVFKYRSKTRYRRKQGHRQDYTALTVQAIVSDEGVAQNGA